MQGCAHCRRPVQQPAIPARAQARMTSPAKALKKSLDGIASVPQDQQRKINKKSDIRS
jgi:hypothetical protein